MQSDFRNQRNPASCINSVSEVPKSFEQKHRVKEIHYRIERKENISELDFRISPEVLRFAIHSQNMFGKKDVTLIVNDNNLKNEILIFEGFFDYLTYRNLDKSDNSNCDYLTLNSTAMFFKGGKN